MIDFYNFDFRVILLTQGFKQELLLVFGILKNNWLAALFNKVLLKQSLLQKSISLYSVLNYSLFKQTMRVFSQYLYLKIWPN